MGVKDGAALKAAPTTGRGRTMRTDDEHLPETDERGPGLGSDFGRPAEGDDEIRERCSKERDKLQAHETADCAGEALRERYEQEEDGGS
jgi:hypothetical protein